MGDSFFQVSEIVVTEKVMQVCSLMDSAQMVLSCGPILRNTRKLGPRRAAFDCARGKVCSTSSIPPVKVRVANEQLQVLR